MRVPLSFCLMLLFINCKNEELQEDQYFSADNPSFRCTGRTSPVESGVNLITSAASVEAAVVGDTAVAYFKNRTYRHHCLAPSHFQQENPAPVLEFEKMNGGGCTTHRDLEDHQVMAQKLLPFFEESNN